MDLMSNFEMQGFGYDWDAELIGGPCDGLTDLVISLTEPHPPRLIRKKIGEDYDKPKLGEKMIEQWSNKPLPEDTKLAVYKLRGNLEDYDDEDDVCTYDFVETLSAREYSNKYEKENE